MKIGRDFYMIGNQETYEIMHCEVTKIHRLQIGMIKDCYINLPYTAPWDCRDVNTFQKRGSG